MYCPKCKEESFKVTSSNTGLVTTRIRKYTDCGHSIHTIESVKYDNYTKSYAKEMIQQNEIKI